MKFILFFACLWLYVAHSLAQNDCVGYVRTIRQTCLGGKDEGHIFGRTCTRNSNRNMWYYDQRNSSCLTLIYYGCGGNTNRYCSLNDCQRKCMRRN